MIPKRETTDRIYEYINVVQKMNDNYWKVMGYTFGPAPEVDVIFGNKYAKVVTKGRHYKDRDESEEVVYGQTTVHSYVNMENGDILKGNWKAPVKNGVRGNINADDVGADRINEYGPIYLKGPSAGRKGLI
jgi:hypothetical protein